MMSKKRICLLAVGLTLLLAAGFFLALPRTLFDEPFSATVWSRDGRLLSAKVAPDGQWRFFPTDSVPGKFRTAITTYEDKRFDRHFGVDPLALRVPRHADGSRAAAAERVGRQHGLGVLIRSILYFT